MKRFNRLSWVLVAVVGLALVAGCGRKSGEEGIDDKVHELFCLYPRPLPLAGGPGSSLGLARWVDRHPHRH